MLRLKNIKKSFAEPDASQRCCVFDTRLGRAGVCNCFDGEFPQTIHRQREASAQVLLWCNASCGDAVLGASHRIQHCGSYAQTYSMWTACANCVAPNASGCSCVHAPGGQILLLLPPDEEALGVATANLAWRDDWSVWRDRME